MHTAPFLARNGGCIARRALTVFLRHGADWSASVLCCVYAWMPGQGLPYLGLRCGSAIFYGHRVFLIKRAGRWMRSTTSCRTRVHMAHDGLPTGLDIDMLYGHPLLAFAAMFVQPSELLAIERHQLVSVFEGHVPPFKGLVWERCAPQALKRFIMRTDKSYKQLRQGFQLRNSILNTPLAAQMNPRTLSSDQAVKPFPRSEKVSLEAKQPVHRLLAI